MKITVNLPVEIYADDDKGLIEALRDLVDNSYRLKTAQAWSWETLPGMVLPHACPDCFGRGGRLPHSGLPYCNCDVKARA